MQRVWLQNLRHCERAQPVLVEEEGGQEVALLFRLRKKLEHRVVISLEIQHVSSKAFLPDSVPQYLLDQSGGLTITGTKTVVILATESSKLEPDQTIPNKKNQN